MKVSVEELGILSDAHRSFGELFPELSQYLDNLQLSAAMQHKETIEIEEVVIVSAIQHIAETTDGFIRFLGGLSITDILRKKEVGEKLPVSVDVETYNTLVSIVQRLVGENT